MFVSRDDHKELRDLDNKDFTIVGYLKGMCPAFLDHEGVGWLNGVVILNVYRVMGRSFVYV